MYCPECGGEYRAGIVRCPTCEVDLTEEPGGAGGGEEARRGPHMAPDLLDLVGFVDEREARDARRRLREGKVFCELVIRDAPGPDRSGEGDEPADEFWIRIEATRMAAAAEILSLDPKTTDDLCPKCGAQTEGEGDCHRCGYRVEAE